MANIVGGPETPTLMLRLSICVYIICEPKIGQQTIHEAAVTFPDKSSLVLWP